MFRDTNFLYDTFRHIDNEVLINLFENSSDEVRDVIIFTIKDRGVFIDVYNEYKLMILGDKYIAELLREGLINKGLVNKFIERGYIESVKECMDIIEVPSRAMTACSTRCPIEKSGELLELVRDYLIPDYTNRYNHKKTRIVKKNAILDYLWDIYKSDLTIRSVYENRDYILAGYMAPINSALLWYAENDDIERYMELNDKGTTRPAFIKRAIENGCVKIFKYLRDNVDREFLVDIIRKDKKCIRQAIIDDHADMIKVLLNISELKGIVKREICSKYMGMNVKRNKPSKMVDVALSVIKNIDFDGLFRDDKLQYVYMDSLTKTFKHFIKKVRGTKRNKMIERIIKVSINIFSMVTINIDDLHVCGGLLLKHLNTLKCEDHDELILKSLRDLLLTDPRNAFIYKYMKHKN